MICAACHHVNDDRAKFCAQCGQPLELHCPACASPVRPDARFCSQCGHNLMLHSQGSSLDAAQRNPGRGTGEVPEFHPGYETGRPLSLEEKLDHLQRYLPSHLTDKILAHRGRLEGERKLVTVLFADPGQLHHAEHAAWRGSALCPHG